MKIISKCDRFLTNFEVLEEMKKPAHDIDWDQQEWDQQSQEQHKQQHKQQHKPSQHKQGQEFEEFRTILHTCVIYLSEANQPCSTQSLDKISVRSLVSLLKLTLSIFQAFLNQEKNGILKKLTKLEILMIINLFPMSRVELLAIVEDAEERLSDEEQIELLKLLPKYMPFNRPTSEEDEDMS